MKGVVKHEKIPQFRQSHAKNLQNLKSLILYKKEIVEKINMKGDVKNANIKV